jgi:hypothetical protein
MSDLQYPQVYSQESEVKLSALERLPTELVIKVYGELPGLFDIVHLAATCKKTQSIWEDRARLIFAHLVGLKNINIALRVLFLDSGM